jgi:MFS transporter, DHA2 family, multidrug resistance protein
VRHWLAFAACVVVGLTNQVGGAVLSLSLQDAGAELHASSAEMQVVMTLSKLLFGAFMLLGGVLGDARGRRRVLVIGAGVIVASSLLASASGSVGQLALARGLDGLGNAAVGPLALALVMSLFPEDQRPRAIGLFLGLSALGVAVGPLAASVVIQAFGWRAGYVAPALVAALGVLGVWNGHWEGGGPPPARLTTTPSHLPVLPARAAVRRALGPRRGISIPVGDPPRSP